MAHLHVIEAEIAYPDLEGYRELAEFYVVNADGEPVECWVVFSHQCWLPETFFRKLIRLFKKIGLFFHDTRWEVSEGISEQAKDKLKRGLAHLTNHCDQEIWFGSVAA